MSTPKPSLIHRLLEEVKGSDETKKDDAPDRAEPRRPKKEVEPRIIRDRILADSYNLREVLKAETGMTGAQSHSWVVDDLHTIRFEGQGAVIELTVEMAGVSDHDRLVKALTTALAIASRGDAFFEKEEEVEEDDSNSYELTHSEGDTSKEGPKVRDVFVKDCEARTWTNFEFTGHRENSKETGGPIRFSPAPKFPRQYLSLPPGTKESASGYGGTPGGLSSVNAMISDMVIHRTSTRSESTRVKIEMGKLVGAYGHLPGSEEYQRVLMETGRDAENPYSSVVAKATVNTMKLRVKEGRPMGRSVPPRSVHVSNTPYTVENIYSGGVTFLASNGTQYLSNTGAGTMKYNIRYSQMFAFSAAEVQIRKKKDDINEEERARTRSGMVGMESLIRHSRASASLMLKPASVDLKNRESRHEAYGYLDLVVDEMVVKLARRK